jgi:hypothetical protein
MAEGIYSAMPVRYIVKGKAIVAKVMIYLPDALAEAIRSQDVNVSRICREALERMSEVCYACGQELPKVVVKEEPPERQRRVVRRPPVAPGQESADSKMAQMQRAVASTGPHNRRNR